MNIKHISIDLSTSVWLFFFLWHLLIQEEALTPEEQQAEKLRVKKLQEDSDLELAKDAFGKSGSPFNCKANGMERKYIL